jgi:drug/metabolite transporter (DMT)-like permease
MTAALAIGLALALLASAALNGSYLLQHAGSAEAPPVHARHPLRTIAGLLRSRLWLAGLVLGLGGWAVHVGALSLAPLSLVQAFVAGGLVLVVPVAARVFGARVGRGESVGIVLMVAALVALSLGAHAPPVTAVPVAAMAVFLGGAAVLAAVLAVLPAVARRPHALGAAGGVLYGAADAATKAFTVGTHTGLGLAALAPWAVLVAVLSAAAFFCFQRGLQIGPALPVIALMTAATNLTSILAGIAILGDPLGPGRALATLHIGAFVAVGVAAWLLAPAQAVLAAPPSDPDGSPKQVDWRAPSTGGTLAPCASKASSSRWSRRSPTTARSISTRSSDSPVS